MVVLSGIPLSLVLSPLVAGFVVVVLDLVNLATPTPDLLGDLIEALEEAGVGSEASETTTPADVPGTLIAALVAVALVPGMAFMFVAWLGVRRLFLRAGAGAVLLAADARAPREDDVEERQLVNLVEEMAIAAGVSPPRVMILDGILVNAAAVGRSVDDAIVVVPRGLLDDLGRDATGAVVADLLAVIVNGDLRVALTIASVFQTFDLVATVLEAPFSRRARRILWRMARLALRRPSRRAARLQDVRLITDGLAEVGSLENDGDQSSQEGCLVIPTLPFRVASLAFFITRYVFGVVLVGPAMAKLWQRRRLLADATAVELTRNPDALAQALQHLASSSRSHPPGRWAHLFLVGPEALEHQAWQRFDERVAEVHARERQAGEGKAAALTASYRQVRAAQDAYGRETQSSPAGPVDDSAAMFVSFLPPLPRRLARLRALGAGPTAVTRTTSRVKLRSAFKPGTAIGRFVGHAIGVILLGLAVLLAAVGLVALVATAIMATLILNLLVFVPVFFLHLLLRGPL